MWVRGMCVGSLLLMLMGCGLVNRKALTIESNAGSVRAFSSHTMDESVRLVTLSAPSFVLKNNILKYKIILDGKTQTGQLTTANSSKSYAVTGPPVKITIDEVSAVWAWRQRHKGSRLLIDFYLSY